jgi:glycosyltransferase involved in cell wall biosynthesis
VRPVLRAAGKTGHKVVAVFAASAIEASVAVRHILEGGVDLPIFLYCRETPAAAVQEECANTTVHRSSTVLFFLAQRELWRHWVALGVAAWNGRRGSWALKIAPFFFHPFRVLVLNENGDFFAGRPGPISNHLSRKTREVCREQYVRAWRLSIAARERWRIQSTRTIQILRGLLAFPFAFLAQQHAPLSRFVFKCMPKREGLVLEPKPRLETGIAIFEYRGREWQGQALEDSLARTDSRWVLIRQTGVSEDVDDMLPLFESDRTFAVSRQRAFRGWQGMLFPTAPFQTLQTGEASNVFAPFSNQILVDRAKLLALGIPSLTECGSSWYLLFWKAAAAGWRSYSVGGGEATVNELPGYPLYEAQFVHALMLEPELARLKPRDSGLSRGNIACAKKGGRSFRGLPRVLILSPYLPYPLSHGGAVRIFSLCKTLSHRIDFVLVCFREKNDCVDYDKLHEVFREVYTVAADRKHRDPQLPEQVCGYESASMRALIPELCFRLQIDLLQIEYTQMAAYRETVPHLPAVLVEHDITFSLYRQLAEKEGTLRSERELRKWLKFEIGRLGVFDQVWTMSENDRQLAIEVGSDPARTLVVRNGVDLKRFGGYENSVEVSAGGSREILYVGSFRHRPNYLGFVELCERIMPVVWARIPGMRLRVVAGPGYEKHCEGRCDLDPRITVHGFVDDVAPLYRHCELVVVPLPVSAGTSIKIMEALAAGRAIVTTPIGCAGLELRDGEDAFIRELGPAFAEAVCDLAQNLERRLEIAKCGRATAEARFNWESIGTAALAAYESATGIASGADDREPGCREVSVRRGHRLRHMLR